MRAMPTISLLSVDQAVNAHLWLGSSSNLMRRDDIGVILASTTTQEAHEWEALQSGVFSYEVRSGLYGAADANVDQKISYNEIASFVYRANEAIPNERFRPRIFCKTTREDNDLADLQNVTVDVSMSAKPAMGITILRMNSGSAFVF
ncbi:MAG: hypothetical protein R3C68_12720 [Myxococcota bacterium]